MCAASVICILWKETHRARQSSLFLGILSKLCISLNQWLSYFLSLVWVLFLRPYSQGWLILLWLSFRSLKAAFTAAWELFYSRPNSLNSPRKRIPGSPGPLPGGSSTQSQNQHQGLTPVALCHFLAAWPWASELISIRLLKRKWMSQWCPTPRLTGGLIDVILHKSVVLGGGSQLSTSAVLLAWCGQVQGYQWGGCSTVRTSESPSGPSVSENQVSVPCHH